MEALTRRAKIHSMWNDVKYLIAYTSPVAASLGLYLGGIWSPGALYVGFLIIPVLEFVLPVRTDNVPEESEMRRNTRPYFDWLLYIHLPVIYTLIAYFAYRVGFTELTSLEII